MDVDPLVPLWLIVIGSVAVGVGAGLLFERTRGAAAKRAAKFEADLAQARSEMMRYQEETARHFGKSAELLGRMATDYRAFLDHFVSGAEELCGNGKQIGATVLDRPWLEEERPVMPPTSALTPPPRLAEDARIDFGRLRPSEDRNAQRFDRTGPESIDPLAEEVAK